MAGFRPPKPEPKPGGLPFWKVLPAWLHDGLAVLSEKAYRMKMGQFRLPTRRFFMLNDPPLIRRVLVDEAGNYPKSDILGFMLKRLMGDSIFTSNGAVWRRQRAMLNPAFEATRVKLVFDQMRRAADEMTARLDAVADGRPHAVDIETTHVTADIILRTIFSESLDRERAEQVFTAFNRFQEIAYGLGMLRVFRVPTFLFFRRNREADRTARDIRGLLAPLIQARLDRIARGEAVPERDFLAAMIEARDPENDQPFDFRELYEQVAMLFLAGHETSASALAWTLYLIASQPDVQARLHAEVAAVLGEREPEIGDLRGMAYLRDVFRESLRLYPPVAFFAREPAVRECMRGKDVKPGSIVFISPWMLHRNIEHWEAPDEFDAGRFDTDKGIEAARCAYMPFSMGPRVCLGAAFAQQEAALILAMLIRRYRFETVEGHVPKPVARLTLRAENGVMLRLYRREAAA
ncbi:cytochrome P450 [Zavarzinia compransoris]|uniref:Cytochrome P450 n=1 Tax=Zavarzinia compransoris TaxID=1264899 RepID=A0A317DYB8_9PROT|nr:cytochrome P450 [Zavarzinia compransoris]PWR19728.1 cytochrome P450 [Zavarzinia compransoris]TDP43324.1 cytochrome P450 [Zavarzinia compransoris]